MKKLLISTALMVSVLSLSACVTENTQSTSDFNAWVESTVKVLDAKGHGPNVGSDEWCRAVDAKLFQRKSGLMPCSAEWNKKVSDTLNKQ